MQRVLACLLLLSSAVPCYAATFEQLIAVLSDASVQSGPHGTWVRVGKVPGVKWQTSTPRLTPAGHTMFGNVKVEGVGSVTIFYTGSKDTVRQLSLSFPSGISTTEFTSTLTRLLPAAKVTQLRGGCKTDGAISGSAVYRIARPGNTHIYAMLISGTSQAGIDTEAIVSTKTEPHWKCQ